MSVPVLKLKPAQTELIGNILARLRAGDTDAFIKPWRDGSYMSRPRNGASGRVYSGYNGFATTFNSVFQGFSSPLWMTAKQVVEHHGTILEGQQPTSIIFTGRYRRKIGGPGADGRLVPLPLGESAPTSAPAPKPATPVAEKAGAAEPGAKSPPEGEIEIGRFVREFAVYNLDQTVDVTLPKKMQKFMEDRAQRSITWTPDEGLAELRRAMENANVAPLFFDQDNMCYYHPGRHEIHAPREGLWRSELDKWEAIAHETIHATGAKHLLKRPYIVNPTGGRDSDGYALEELTAVMGSLFICQETGVSVTPEREQQWTSYLCGYRALEILEKNPSLFVQAIVRADFAAQFALHPDKRPDFIRDAEAPRQVEITFAEFATDVSVGEPPVDGAKIESEVEWAIASAAELERTATTESPALTR